MLASSGRLGDGSATTGSSGAGSTGGAAEGAAVTPKSRAELEAARRQRYATLQSDGDVRRRQQQVQRQREQARERLQGSGFVLGDLSTYNKK